LSTNLVLLVVLCLIWIFSQLGGRLSAKNALAWWGAALLLGLTTIAPDLLTPLSQMLGISLVSNFVMAALIFFLFVQAMQTQVTNTDLGFKLREIGTSLAADEFVIKRSSNPKEPRPTALIVLPCYNEEANIRATLEKLNALTRSRPGEFDFCFVNDCSQDSSETLLQTLAPQHFTSHRANLGVSGGLCGAMRCGRPASRA
jgi:hypothetical protein